MLDYIFWFVANIAIELSAAWLLGIRKNSILSSVVGVNLVTHPILHYLLWLASIFGLFVINLQSIIILEFLVAVAEAFLISFALPKMRLLDAAGLSLFMNACSFGLGLLIMPIY